MRSSTRADTPLDADVEDDESFPGRHRFPWSRIAYVTTFGGGLAWTLSLLARSPEAATKTQDEIAHVLIAKHAWSDPHLLLDAWGRPVNTLLFSVPSRFGLTGARIGAVVIAALTVVVATLIARSLGVKRLYLVPLLLWFQPWFHDFAYAAVTPIPFSFLLALSIYCWVRGRHELAAFVFGLLPLIRWEALALLPLAAIALAASRRWRAILFLAAPLGVYLAVGAVAAGHAITLGNYLNSPGFRGHGHDAWTHYFAESAPLIGAPILVLAALGIPAAVGNRRLRAAVVPWVAYFVLEVVLRRMGRGAGFAEFVLPVAPGVAILAASGVGWVTRWVGAPRAYKAIAGLVIVATAAAGLAVGLQTDPRRPDQEALVMKHAAQWLHDGQVEAPVVVSTHPWFQYYFGIPHAQRLPGLTDGGRTLPSGTIVVWDRHYSDRRNYQLHMLQNAANGWTRLVTFGDGMAVIFRRDRPATFAPPKGPGRARAGSGPAAPR